MSFLIENDNCRLVQGLQCADAHARAEPRLSIPKGIKRRGSARWLVIVSETAMRRARTFSARGIRSACGASAVTANGEGEVGALGLLIYQAAKTGSVVGLRFALSRKGGEWKVLRNAISRPIPNYLQPKTTLTTRTRIQW